MKKNIKNIKKEAEKITKSKFMTEFKEFALKGKVLDLAVGVVIGSAFSKIVSSLVTYIIMPLLGILIGGLDLNSLVFSFGEATVYYGIFLQNIIDFVIIAFSIFLFIKFVSFVKEPQEVKIEEPNKTDTLLEEIRDLLKKRKA